MLKKLITFIKTSKLLLILVLSILYVFTWITFGLLFTYEANKTYGDAFVFQKDIIIKYMAKEFRKKFRFPKLINTWQDQDESITINPILKIVIVIPTKLIIGSKNEINTPTIKNVIPPTN